VDVRVDQRGQRPRGFQSRVELDAQLAQHGQVGAKAGGGDDLIEGAKRSAGVHHGQARCRHAHSGDLDRGDKLHGAAGDQPLGVGARSTARSGPRGGPRVLAGQRRLPDRPDDRGRRLLVLLLVAVRPARRAPAPSHPA
jgi:hypothetical protein